MSKMVETLWKALRPDWTSLDEVLPNGKGKALDIGAGSGRHRIAIEKAGYEWTGCDYAEERGPEVIKADARDLSFESNTFDLVVIWQVMEYLDDPWQAVAEIFRVLKPGGIVIGSASFLEPMHGRVYFNFSHYGLIKLLESKGFKDIFFWPGIGCFPLIGWTWVRQLTGSEQLAKCALWSMRIFFWGISFVFDRISALKHTLGFGYGSKGKWIREIAPYHFAGQITFRAIKEN